MTDGWLMDAECIHGNNWYDCDECDLDSHVAVDDTGEILRSSEIIDDEDDIL